MRDVTAAIPTIPPRATTTLPHTLATVFNQTHPVSAVSIAQDSERVGAWHTRQRALDAVRTTWTAFIDDDDRWKPEHLEHLLDHAENMGADYVFSWYELGTLCGKIDRIGHFGKEFDPANPHHTTMNILVRTELAKEVGFTAPPDGSRVGGEDWRFTLGCVAAGARIVHLAERTWIYNCWPGGTHGLPVW